MPVIKKHGGNKPKWNKSDKIEALLLLQRNHFNLSATAKELNINKQTLEYWRKQMGDDVYGTARDQKKAEQRIEIMQHKDKIEAVRDELEIIKAARDITVHEGDLINSIYVAKFALMDKIVELAKNSTSMRDCAYALEIIQKAEIGFVDKDLQNQFQTKKNSFMDMVKQTYPDFNKVAEDVPFEVVNAYNED